MRTLIGISCFFLSFVLSFGLDGPINTPAKSSKPLAVVIGFVGGFVRHDDMVHSAVYLAARLRSEYASGVYVQAFENGREHDAHRKILQLLDTRHDGKLSAEEKQDARIVIYGHSWGASEAIHLARELGSDGIPVLLTIQVDSVSKMGENDTVIPPNVAQAVNFYQLDGFLHGRAKIIAADAGRTQILGNFRMVYKQKPIQCPGYPWWDFLVKPHTEIECDPHVWNQVEALIRSHLPVPEPNALLQHPAP
jgi:hypothetical protein